LCSISKEEKLSKLAAENLPPLVVVNNEEEVVVSQMKEQKFRIIKNANNGLSKCKAALFWTMET